MDPNDINGIIAFLSIHIDKYQESGKPQNVYKNLKEKAPGACRMIEGILAYYDNYMTKFGDSSHLGKLVI